MFQYLDYPPTHSCQIHQRNNFQKHYEEKCAMVELIGVI